jgi:hypothetical protein
MQKEAAVGKTDDFIIFLLKQKNIHRRLIACVLITSAA